VERPSETPAAAPPLPTDEHSAPAAPTDPAAEANDARTEGPSAPREFATIRPLGGTESKPAAPWGSAGRSSDFFGARAAGKRFVYVVDASASMRGGAFEEARAELRRSIAELTPTQSFCVFFFNSGYRATPRRAGRAFWKADKQSVAALSEWAEGIVPDGGTDPGAALLDALQLKPDAVFFLTDGGFETDIAATVAEANRERIPIHTIAFGPNAADDLLERMATESGGRFRKVAPAR
jgi:Mg-chelatase subunit ChlD